MKLALLLLSTTLLLSACGTKDSSPETSPKSEPVAEVTTDEPVSESTEEPIIETETESEANDIDIAALGDIAVDEGLFDVELVVPKDFVGETTQEELDALAKEMGYKSITLHEDGSATYVMTKAQHKEMMTGLTETINSSLSDMIASENYPNFTDIEANDNFTSFTITTKSAELDFAESISVLGFYMYGGMYNTFAGTPVDNIHVEFINVDSGEVISSADSKNMGE